MNTNNFTVDPRRIRFRRALRWLCISILAAVGVIAAVPSLRIAFLKKIGWVLVATGSPPASADVIVLALDSEFPAALKAADLVNQGVSKRVAVLTSSQPWESEYTRRGVPLQSVDAVTRDYLVRLGVPEVERIPVSAIGSEDVGDVLPEWCEQKGFKSVIVISTPDHSYRLERILGRSMKGHHLTSSVLPTPYSSFNPDQWWQTRGGIRTEIIELEKLVLDVLRHPFS